MIVRSSSSKKKRSDKRIIGWREWVAIPDLSIDKIKAKIDTGAKTSTLHAYDIKLIKRGRHQLVSFRVHPKQRSTDLAIQCEAEFVELRRVKDSGGRSTLRPVIQSNIVVGGVTRKVEITLVNRDAMGFRMLLGRQAIRGYFVVDVAKSYVNR